MPKNILVDISEGVGIITLNRPPVNAMDTAMRSDLVAILDGVSERDDVRCVVLTSSQKVFCAGADLKDRPEPEDIGAFSRHNRLTRETGNTIMECAKPIIAAVNGGALGLGFVLAAYSDIILTSEDAYFSMPEINVGLAGGAAMLRTVLSRSEMRRLFYTGDRLSAQDAFRMGFVSGVYPSETLMDEALTLARNIASKSPLGILYAKRSCDIAEHMPLRDAYLQEQQFTVALSKTEDAKEARTAFLEKRKPVFTNR